MTRDLRCPICHEALGEEPTVLTQHGNAHERCSKAGAVRRVAKVSAPSRLDQLRSMAASRPHQCAGFGCDLAIPSDRLMCDGHWQLLPTWLRERLDATHDPNGSTHWPVELAEQAIGFTMTTSDRAGLLARAEGSLQERLFEAAS